MLREASGTCCMPSSFSPSFPSRFSHFFPFRALQQKTSFIVIIQICAGNLRAFFWLGTDFYPCTMITPLYIYLYDVFCPSLILEV
jgi:hypothetical protein